MKLTVYLFKDNIKSFDGLIYERYLEGENPFKSISPIADFGFECTAFVQANKAKTPKWTEFLGEGFDIEALKLRNTSNSFVVFVNTSGRVFAFTFGYAYSAIDRGKIEPSFGLRVTLNMMGSKSLNTIDTRNIDLVTRQSRIHLNAASSIHEFEINTSVDLLRYAKGKPENDQFVSNVSGADSLQVTIDCTLPKLKEVADELFRLYSATTYKERFPFIDALVPLNKENPVTVSLNGELFKMIDDRETTKIAIAYPEIPHPDTSCYKVFRGRDNVEVSEIDIMTIYSFLDENPIENPLAQVNIIALDASGEAKSQKRSLGDFIVCEIDYEDCKYVFSLGLWFRVAADFISQVRNYINQLPDLTKELALPPMKKGEQEDEYNARVAEQRQWLLLDKKQFKFDTYAERIEACDILTDTGILIAVKKMRSSATLSHLFAQGSVSARLLKMNEVYIEALLSLLKRRWPEKTFNRDQFQFLYAISTDKRGPIADCLFFFSMINLMEHVQRIQLAGYKASLCKIEYEDANV